MYLKNLELVGFKSFPEKTTFMFTEGITCIVGPNGCGKTNLLDALRWVLGEQKTSLLRGSKMEEVIFAGTRTLKPLGMAEVSLHLENRDGTLPSQYGELSVTRRLFRSGDSEYLMNKVPCRLRDITDLFADTGLGSHAYAIIQQEMVDAILSDRPDERRFLFEEAAGITRYKHRKLAAERKMEATEQDLLRLQDILAEVNTRVNSLRRQVGKARRYQTISEELKNWDLFNARTRYAGWRDRGNELAEIIKSFGDKKLSRETQLDGRFTELEEMRRMLIGLDHDISESSKKVYELSETGHKLETDISVNREKKENLEKSSARNRGEIDALNKRAEIIREDKTKCQDDLEQLVDELDKISVELEQSLAGQKTSDDAYLQFRSIADDESSKLIDLEGKISSGRTDSANIDEQVRDLQNEIEQHNQHRGGLIEEKSLRRRKIDSLQKQVDAAKTELSADEESITSKEKELNEILIRADRLRDNLAELSSSYEATLARKSLLAEMVRHYEGYGNGVAAVFEMAGRWVDITGAVADFIHPHEGYRASIEAALGEAAQYILCRNQSTAQEAINVLRQEKAGRATFLILDKLTNPASRPELPDIPDVVGWADSLVDCDDRYQRVPSTLLGETVVCKNNEVAYRLLEQLPSGYRAATIDGELYSNDGLLTGGVSEEMSPIGRREEIKSLEQKLDDLNRQIGHINNKQAEATLKIGEFRQTLSQLKQKLEDDKDEIAELTSRLKEEQFKINAADEVITSIDRQVDQHSQKVEKLKSRRNTLTLDFGRLGREKADIDGLVQSRKRQLEELEQAAHGAAEEVNHLQVARIEMESKRSQLLSQLAHFDEMLSDIAANIEQRKQQTTEAETVGGELTRQTQDDEIRLKELFDQRQEESAAQKELHQRHDRLNGTINDLEQQVKNLRKEKEQIAEETHRAEISLTEIKSKIQQIEEQIRNEYDMEIADLEIESPKPELSDEQAQARVEELRNKLHRMGIVNLLALEEYEEQKQRQEFLSKQLDDLIEARRTLKVTIQKINQTAKTMFLDTLDKARENFKQMYEELFADGEADVILEDPSDPLESPMDIISRPRGKKPLTIAQLSGGERALTAISLLFALYMVKPSPFCFLDEIDAPLDDVNVRRFLRIVKKFSQQTQFIIITHNKITMEAADTLYGVTMEEPGVSKVVSVRFRKGDEIDDAESLIDGHYAHDDKMTQTG